MICKMTLCLIGVILNPARGSKENAILKVTPQEIPLKNDEELCGLPQDQLEMILTFQTMKDRNGDTVVLSTIDIDLLDVDERSDKALASEAFTVDLAKYIKSENEMHLTSTPKGDHYKIKLPPSDNEKISEILFSAIRDNAGRKKRAKELLTPLYHEDPPVHDTPVTHEQPALRANVQELLDAKTNECEILRRQLEKYKNEREQIRRSIQNLSDENIELKTSVEQLRAGLGKFLRRATLKLNGWRTLFGYQVPPNLSAMAGDLIKMMSDARDVLHRKLGG